MRPATAKRPAQRFVKLVTPITARSGNILGTGLAYEIHEDQFDVDDPEPLTSPFCVYSLFDYEIDDGYVIEIWGMHGVILAKDILC